MDLEFRTIGEDELGDFLRGVTTGFGMTTPDEHDEYPVHLLPTDRCLVVRDADTIVARSVSPCRAGHGSRSPRSPP